MDSSLCRTRQHGLQSRSTRGGKPLLAMVWTSGAGKACGSTPSLRLPSVQERIPFHPRKRTNLRSRRVQRNSALGNRDSRFTQDCNHARLRLDGCGRRLHIRGQRLQLPRPGSWNRSSGRQVHHSGQGDGEHSRMGLRRKSGEAPAWFRSGKRRDSETAWS